MQSNFLSFLLCFDEIGFVQSRVFVIQTRYWWCELNHKVNQFGMITFLTTHKQTPLTRRILIACKTACVHRRRWMSNSGATRVNSVCTTQKTSSSYSLRAAAAAAATTTKRMQHITIIELLIIAYGQRVCVCVCVCSEQCLRTIMY